MKILHLLPLLIVACTPPAGTDTDGVGATAADTISATVMAGRIRVQEDSLFASKIFDRPGAMAMLGVYEAFVRTFPKDTIAPEYLFRAAGLAKALGNADRGVQLYDRIITEYPSWRRITSAYYMKAFTIDDGLNDKEAAKKAYEEVIARFPDHAFAKDSRAMIENLQYTDEELIERFKRMEQGQASQ